MTAPVRTTSTLDFVPRGDVFPSPEDWRDQFIYFLLVDRFHNNDDTIPPYDPVTAPRGRDPKEGRRFQGGNLKGITSRLEYIKDLGCTAIWLSPIFKNRLDRPDSYHGYGIQDFLEVDPRFGTKDDLRALVEKAHFLGMYVILDIVLNHTGDNWAYPGDFPYYFWKGAPGPFDFGFWRQMDPSPGLQPDDAVWPMELQDPDFYKRRGQIWDWNDPDQVINGDFFGLKELDLKRPQCLDTMIKIYKYWMALADIDGYRLDTVKHMEDSAVAILCNAVREYAMKIGKKNFFLFGEVVGDDVIIQRYIGRNSRIEGTNERFPSLDACLDFPLYFVLEEVIKGFKTPMALVERYERFKTLYSDHGEASRYFVTFVDNHDQMCRPYRRFMHGNPYRDQVVLAVGYLLTSQGVPCIYYGTEQGFDGGGENDSYVRECMFGGRWGAFDTTGVHFFDSSNDIFRAISNIAKVRAQEPALRYGRQYFREISQDGHLFRYPVDGRSTLAYSRILDSDEVLVALNLDVEERADFITVDKKLSPPGATMADRLRPGKWFPVEEREGRAAVKLPIKGHSMAILKRVS